MSTIALDAFDYAILGLLQRDNQMPQREIATQVHLSAPAVQRRIRRLQDLGVISANVAVLNPSLLGLPLTVLVSVQLLDERPQASLAFRARVQAEPAVQQCYYVTGESDYMLVITAADMHDYQALASRLFAADHNIRRYTSSIAMERIKTGLQLALPSSSSHNETNTREGIQP
ncbi:Lrp/AsnC family transcriptional regulator [Comamonas composti]|uniref:Lrp/AsnC family transcriptional regulator n=1 Tax=Comamonas composti TaxID=408558 RepID=UPI0004299103|nr:Lrp/AsnC family transcriptional regulator [Comamonas composti]